MIRVLWYSGTPLDKAYDRLVHHTINATQRSQRTHVVIQVDDIVLTHGRNQASFWAVAEPFLEFCPPEQVTVVGPAVHATYDLAVYNGLPFSWVKCVWNQVVRKCRLPEFMLVDHINCVELTSLVLRHLGYDVDAHDFDQLERQLEV